MPTEYQSYPACEKLQSEVAVRDFQVCKMANKSPIFPMPQPQHFSDYGFDPQIDYFQILEEARKQKRERSIDSFHFKLQKPISKDESKRTHKYCNKKKKKKRYWWINALHFLKRRWTTTLHGGYHDNLDLDLDLDLDKDVHRARAKAFRATISGPIYVTDSRSGSTTPYRTVSRPTSGPLAGSLSAITPADLSIPYLSLRELTMEQQQLQQRVSTSAAMPIYLVT